MNRVFLVFAVVVFFAISAFATIVPVTVSGTSYNPANITVQQGDTVRWTNNNGGFHNAMSDAAPIVINSGPPSSNWVYSWDTHAITPATYGYHCEVHGMGMHGNVTVEGGATGNNDNCDEPLEITDGDTEFSTLEATRDPGIATLPNTCEAGFGVAIVSDIWFNYYAACTGTVTASTCGTADYDTRMACYSMESVECPPCPTNNNNFLACNDDGDGCADFTSILEFEVTEGNCYLIRLGGYPGAPFDSIGTGTLNITCATPPVPGISVNPTSLDFGDVPIDEDSARVVVITNTGTAALVLSTITCPTGFTNSPGGPPIQPGLTRNLTITFNPDLIQNYTGNVTINSNAPTSPTLVAVEGAGVQDLAVDPKGVVEEYYVVHNFPNPFNPTTTISFAIPNDDNVRVTVFNTAGQVVAVLNNGMLTAGRHNFAFNGTNLASGLYLTRVELSDRTLNSKLLLLK